MTARYDGDRCPACGSHQVIPYAVLVGGAEEYGYQCLACEVMWPVIFYGGNEESAQHGCKRNPAA
jgi:hypothetical protein